ncbi:hypothetical protein MRN14_11875 [bacterium 19NY03SH02]|uniref:Uncharacterized protein n=1 Tax=bacterium 19NY03SH02 TaxID=2920631 RepID=A0AAU6UXP9_UNCXX
MKGLFSVLGLITALLFSTAARADIYSQVGYQPPKFESVIKGSCSGMQGFVTPSVCETFLVSQITGIRECGGDVTDSVSVLVEPHPSKPHDFSVHKVIAGCSSSFYKTYLQGSFSFNSAADSKSCPPDSYPNYTYEKDDNGDGQADRCFNPMELDSASKCADAYNGGMNLEAGNNTAPTVCKTYLDGARCAFSKTVTQGGVTFYSPNLEQVCFGNDSLPEYDESTPSTMPGDEQCSPYGSGYVCAADPANYCDAQGKCVDGCGYVNGQFACFRDQECTGDTCEPAPINCESSPDAAVCKDTDPEPDPDPEPCTGDDCDPTDPDNPGTGGGGSSFQLDYDRLINGMKDAAKLLIDDQELPDFKQYTDKITEFGEEHTGYIDEIKDASVFEDWKNAISNPIFSSLETMFTSGGAGQCSFDFLEFQLDICKPAERVREILYWVFAILTIFYLRHLFYETLRR